jgi:predicted MFS family arabinose efflux permease
MRDVWVLALAQACSACGTIMLATFGGIVGATLAPSPAIATLPLSLSVLGTALGSIPASRLMQRVGRKPAFIGSAFAATLAALLCAFSIYHRAFLGLCVAGALMGVTMAFVQQYRFAAAEFVTPALAGRAVSTVMLGTLAAAVLAPEVGDRARLLWGWPEFTGSFVALAGICLAAAGVLAWLDTPPVRAVTAARPARALRVVARQPVFIAAVAAGATAYAVMSFIMAATPISMRVVDGMSVAETKSVISLHLLGMFVPSLASGWLVREVGVRGLMATGLACMATCVGVGVFVGQHFTHYLTALLLLGVGWNFLFVAGTTLLTTAYAPEERFAAQGFNDFVVFGTQALASLLAGPAIMRLGWPVLNAASLPLLVAMAGVVVWLGARDRRAATSALAAS